MDALKNLLEQEGLHSEKLIPLFLDALSNEEITLWIDQVSKEENQPVKHFLSDVDDSDYTLKEWLQSWLYLYTNCKKDKNVEPSWKLCEGYIACSTEGARNENISRPLVALIQEYYDSYGLMTD